MKIITKQKCISILQPKQLLNDSRPETNLLKKTCQKSEKVKRYVCIVFHIKNKNSMMTWWTQTPRTLGNTLIQQSCEWTVKCNEKMKWLVMKWIMTHKERQTKTTNSTPPACPAREWWWVLTSHSSHRGSSMHLFYLHYMGVKGGRSLLWSDSIQSCHTDSNVVFSILKT